MADAITRAEELLVKARKKQPNLQAGEVRFPAERCALNLTYHLFEIFRGERMPTHVPSLSEIQTSIQRLLDTMHLSDTQECDSESLITYSAERNLLTNFFTICLLRAKKGEPLDDKALLHAYYRQFKRNIEETNFPVSFLVWTMYYAVSWWLSEDKSERKKMRYVLDEYLSGNAVEANSVFPYDGERFNFLREVPRILT